MKKTEKYSSFHEMKESSTSISPANAAVVMERHDKFEKALSALRKDFINSKSSLKSVKP